MQFTSFVSKSLSLITSPFIQSPPFTYSASPKPFYIELFFVDKIKKIKLQEWKFQIKAKSNEEQKVLIESEEEEDDHEDKIKEISSFFDELLNTRQQIQPRAFIQQNKEADILAELKYSTSELIPFDGRSTFHLQLATFQSTSFICFLSLKYNYEEDDPSLISELNQEESEDQFELLIDQSYEKRKIQEAKQQNRKWSQNVIIMANDLSLSPMKAKISQKQEKIAKLRGALTNIDWKSIRNKTLSQFMKEHSGCN